jgi:hypothetical protein
MEQKLAIVIDPDFESPEQWIKIEALEYSKLKSKWQGVPGACRVQRQDKQYLLHPMVEFYSKTIWMRLNPYRCRLWLVFH